MGFQYIHRLVGEFQEPNTSHAKQHENDLKYSSLMLYNHIVSGLRSYGSKAKGSWVDIVLKASDVIEETTLMREQMKDDEAAYKNDLRDFYFGQEMQYRLPSKVRTYKAFRMKKSNKVKDYAVEIVTKMYRIDRVNRQEMKQEIDNGVGLDSKDGKDI